MVCHSNTAKKKTQKNFLLVSALRRPLNPAPYTVSRKQWIGFWMQETIFRFLSCLFFSCMQLTSGISAILCHHNPPQPAASPRRGQDGCAFSGWAAENGSLAKEKQPQVPRHHHRLSAALILRKPGEQGEQRPHTWGGGFLYLSKPNFVKVSHVLGSWSS